jgi:hypothetical protein
LKFNIPCLVYVAKLNKIRGVVRPKGRHGDVLAYAYEVMSNDFF